MRLANVDGRPAVVGANNRICAGPFDLSMTEVYECWDEFVERARNQQRVDEPLPPQWLGPPSPQPSQVFAVALNYLPHAAEGGYEPPSDPLVFTKFPSCVTGPYTTVELPGDKVD